MAWTWVAKKDEEKLRHLALHVEGLWSSDSGHREPRWYTCHDDNHSRHVGEAIQFLLPESECRRGEITPDERFCLQAAAWLHDVGMIVYVTEDNLKDEQVRTTHHDRSRNYIKKEYPALQLTQGEAEAVGDIAWYHPKFTDITKCAPKMNGVRTRLLAAYLRLADAISRTEGDVSKRQFNTLIAVGMPGISQFHWIKSLFVRRIDPDPDNKEIVVRVTHHDNDEGEIKALGEIVRDEIREELKTVWEIILRERAAHYLDVKLEAVGATGPAPDVHQLETLRQYLGNRDLEFQAPSRELARTLIDTVQTLAGGVGDADAYRAIHQYVTQVLPKIRANRSCHTLFKEIHDALCSYAKEPPDQVANAGHKLTELLAFLHAKLETMDQKLRTVVEYSRAFLCDGEPILLFGRSTSVVACLSAQPPEVKARTEIYVLENRSKTRFNFLGQLSYCDGIQYAEDVANAGCVNVHIVPDVAVANLMERKIVRKVVFGANGIDLRKRILLHTAGHRTIADLAKAYAIPLFVIADSDKFGPAEPDQQKEREGWLKQDNRLLQRLPDSVSLFNPREDAVECAKVTMLISDEGAFRPDSPPAKVMAAIDPHSVQE